MAYISSLRVENTTYDIKAKQLDENVNLKTINNESLIDTTGGGGKY